MLGDFTIAKFSRHELIDSLHAALILQKFEFFPSLRQVKASFVLVIPLEIQLGEQFVRVRETKWIVGRPERIESFLELSFRRVELAEHQVGATEIEIIGGKRSLISCGSIDFLG